MTYGTFLTNINIGPQNRQILLVGVELSRYIQIHKYNQPCGVLNIIKFSLLSKKKKKVYFFLQTDISNIVSRGYESLYFFVFKILYKF